MEKIPFTLLPTDMVTDDTILCCKVKSPTMVEEKLLIVIPDSLHWQFLTVAHDKAGHQGIDRTISQLSQTAYWVRMAKDVIHHCSLAPNANSPNLFQPNQHHYNPSLHPDLGNW